LEDEMTLGSRLTFAAVLLATLLIGCGGTPAGTADPTFVRTTNLAIDDEIGSVCATKADGRARCWNADGTALDDLTLPDAHYARVQRAGVGPIGLTDDGRLFGPRGAIPDDLPPIADFRATNLWGHQGLCLRAQDGRLFYGNYIPDGAAPRALQVEPGPFVDIDCAFEGLVCGLAADGTVFGGFCPTSADWAQISISVSLSCGLTRAGDIVCSPGTLPASGGVPAFTHGPYRHIVTTYQAACALDTAGELTCVRSDGAPVSVDAGPYTSVVGGRDLVCGLRPDGTTACFRQNADAGSFGSVPTFTAFGPVAPPLDPGW
jgi:hypothetical protein